MAAQEKQQIKEVKAYARYIHVSPRKLRLVADLIRRTPVDTALEQLRFSSKKAAQPISKVINSAIANAVHNFELNRDDLYIKSITVDAGPVIKKLSPRAQGRGFIERKRLSHISVLLEPRIRTAKKTKRSIFSIRPAPVAAEPKQPEEKMSGKIEVEKQKAKTPPKSGEKVKKHLVDLKRRLFNRKSGQ
ncbi:MAG: 50S ribosomal protein L22 [Candidatus Doudnabacteria bacterium RIFCSPLOWO2_02_FULL_48_8]|uniref:Large ribosomal subunit protein uL22 n=2 Tax=Candidatus Doudnaibacteriota TaxID=1817799 RepID=A0A1F5PYX4_9BACT|nr:ribosomal protein L22 [uncultured bacterium]OGE81472.1 MAG: 50S ribosomal protein L22 [Candidatus Doudnabacteria bacterium RIFCSPHIGHO2_01_FULL_46_24]OGE94912.1 MAG: 50S ribosomal protein L22 [Candidatus Doudnabacteria bacterium RIFCSPLOWO2_01_FULL_44_21]OGE95064.1 MAG: 50S ribosomal protein L22 [Candidatus Doudnabacteria bacterium RIFCSPLOWO2_02_FULL_48_8]OGE95910.1 MAG: 50S ribosomal protein L22 [Candidatus Doudnabacteria bacterium RIFCSPHIGHO2_12_FULL_48_11]